MVAIFVDGDACPVKDETYVVASRYGLPVALVANAPLRVPEGLGVQLIVVGEGLDAADDWIAANVRPGDVVVTADIPLAARCLDAGAGVLGPTGRVFTEASIAGALVGREVGAHLRETRRDGGGPPPISPRDRSRFASKLDELVQRSLRAHGRG